MAESSNLLEVAKLLRQAASLLESEATGHAPTARAPRVVDLRGKIKTLLDDGEDRTSAEVAERLYSGEMGMDMGTFRRRVVVTLSSMHTKEGTVEIIHSKSGTKWRKALNPLHKEVERYVR